MARIAIAVAACVFSAAVFALPARVDAQERASIVGGVRDTSGAVLPGVTVEATSPVLIERVRSAATDGAGRYAIVDLRPGTYLVTFTLPGFKTVRREGIVLRGEFSATVNADLEVGELEETVTVSGAAPVVDLRSTQSQTVLSRDALDVLPAARTMQGGASLVPGVSFYSQGFTSNMSYHGSDRRDQHIYQDGMNIGQNLTQQGQQANGVSVNELAQSELVYDAGSQSAENAIGGVRMNAIPKEGGNTVAGSLRAFRGTGALQNDNVTPELRPFIREGNKLDYTYDVNTAVGGPIMRDRIWFFVAQRVAQTNTFIPLPPGIFPAYPDGGQSESGGEIFPNSSVRLTMQLSPRNKLGVAGSWQRSGTRRFDVGCRATSFNRVSCISPEASYWLPAPKQWAAQAKWTSPVSNRVLVEVAQSIAIATFQFKYQPENGPLDIQHFNSSTNVRTVATATGPSDYLSSTWNTAANLSYVTGSHNFKVGINHQWGNDHTLTAGRHGDTSVLTSVNVAGVPTPAAATVTNSPHDRKQNLDAQLGLFAQDKWTLDRLTLTYGARFDYFAASTPEQSATGGLFMSPAAQVARAHIDPVSCIPCWNDWSIRLGASYDLFGTGRTALKTSIGKFVAQEGLGLATSVNPLAVQSDTRAWRDLDSNGSILDANGNVQFAELGPSRNSRFGLPGGGTQFDPNLPRGTNWEESLSVQHELVPNVSVTAGYYRRHFQNLSYTKNTLVDPDRDYTPFTITIPQTPNLPNGGGQVITMYNLNTNKLGAVNNIRTWSERNTRVYNGFEVSVNARLPRGGFIFGGITTERTATDECADLADSNPNNRRFCKQVPPFQTLYKAAGAYTLPYDVNISMTFQARPGISTGSFYVFNSAIAGVPLTGGGTMTVTVVDPTERYYDYVKTNDIRITRTIRLGRARIQPFVEIFNVLNLSTILTVNENIGPNYFNPGSIVEGRRLQLGGQIDW